MCSINYHQQENSWFKEEAEEDYYRRPVEAEDPLMKHTANGLIHSQRKPKAHTPLKHTSSKEMSNLMRKNHQRKHLDWIGRSDQQGFKISPSESSRLSDQHNESTDKIQKIP